MLPFLKSLLGRGPRRTGASDDGESAEERAERLRVILRSEMTRDTLDGRQVTHRRLETLMLVTGTDKKETMRLLRDIGARPSSRHGAKIWTMQPKS